MKTRMLWQLVLALITAWTAAGASAYGGASAATADGAELYAQYCSGCHGVAGRGLDERYPSLHFDDAAWQEPDALIRSVLRGSHRRTVTTAMPDQGFLGNETLAAVLTFVRTAFGPGDEPVHIEDVARARLALVQGYHDEEAVERAGVGPLAGLGRPAALGEPPPMSPAAYQRARQHYESLCTGCHGVFRTGTAGNPLPPEWMRELGTEYLRQVIGFGSARGMPDWLDAHDLEPEDINNLALFLQHPVPPAAAMDMATIRGSWTVQRPLADRPTAPAHEYALEDLFVVALHDPGAVLLIHGPSREPIVQIPVGGPPHRIAASASGRYLHVVARNGKVALIDLYASPPERVASIRVGFEARAVGGSRHADSVDRYVLAGSDWPPQLLLLDGTTLEPLQRLDTPLEADVPDAELGDVIASPWEGTFVVPVRRSGRVLLLGETPPMTVDALDAEPTLRSGALTEDGRYLLLPTDSRRVVVMDLPGRELVADRALPFAGAGQGVVYRHGEHGPVWVTGSMVSDQLAVVGADPSAAPEDAWQVIATLDGPAMGSLFLATHANSEHLWVDSPLAEFGHASQEVAVFRRDVLEDGYRSLPIAAWADLEEGPRRVLQPTYSARGDEVWLLVWSTADAESAIVIVDDATLELREVLRDAALLTPMRLYSVAALTAAAAPLAMDDDDVQSGASLFQAHCAGCHGAHGEGDGPMTPHLEVVLKDLRSLSARNEGVFPEGFVRQIIDGRETRMAHGPAGKPVWGEFFGLDEDSSEVSEALARERIDALIRFLKALQRQPD